MLQIQDTLISLDILEKKFVCDLPLCLGMCCRYGDSGAPLNTREARYLKNHFRQIKPFLRREGIEAIEQQGTSVIDADGDRVTPLIRGEECAYTLMENGMYACGIEKAWEKKKSGFRKPESCYLFPVRITKLKDYEALNYDRWNICKPARALGDRENVYLYEFLREALIRRYGKKWYTELEKAAKEWREQAAPSL